MSVDSSVGMFHLLKPSPIEFQIFHRTTLCTPGQHYEPDASTSPQTRPQSFLSPRREFDSPQSQTDFLTLWRVKLASRGFLYKKYAHYKRITSFLCFKNYTNSFGETSWTGITIIAIKPAMNTT